MYKVFVYGSLKKGYHNHHYLKSSKFLGNATIEGATLYNMGISFPCMKIDNSENVIYGEVYEVDYNTLKNVDLLEGYNEDCYEYNLYNRQEVIAYLEDGSSCICYSYEWARNVNKDWKVISKW